MTDPTKHKSPLHRLNSSKFLNNSLMISAGLCAVFFVVLFHSIRFEPDDMITSGTLTASSLWDVLIDKYHSTSFRPLFVVTSFLTIGYHVADANHYYTTVFIYFLCVYVLFIFSIYKLLQEIFSLKDISVKQKALLLCFSNLLFACIYFFTTEKIEVFGWYCCSTIYLLPSSMLCFATWVLLKKQKNILDLILLFLCAMLIAGGAEHVPASAIAAIFSVAVILFLTKRNDKLFFMENKNSLIKTAFFGGALVLFFLIYVTNPGLWSHYSDAHSNAFQSQGNPDFTETIVMFFRPAKLIGLLLLAGTWVLFSKTFSAAKKINLNYFIGVLCATIVVAALTSLFAYKQMGVGRVWFLADISLVILLSALILKFSSHLNITSKTTHVLSVSIVVIFFFFDIRHVPALLYFSSGHDKIVSDLRQQDSGKVIVLTNFPSPDLTNQVELSADPDNAENQLFCKFYGIKAKVALRRMERR
jgi:hypothetical protein